MVGPTDLRAHLLECRTRCLEALRHAADSGNPVAVINASAHLAIINELLKERFGVTA